MKIFHIGCCVQLPPINGMQKAFIANCDEYRELNCGEKDLDKKCLEISNYFQPDLIFMQIQTENIIHRSTVAEMKRRGAFVINWTGDIRNNVPQWMIEIADCCNLTCFSNMRDVEWMKRMGHASEYLEQGYDPEIYKPEGEVMEMPPIVYFANNYINQFPLSPFRIQMVDFLQKKFGDNFGAYGSGWNKGRGNFNHSQPIEASAYRGAKIAINVSNYEVKQYSSDRIHRIMGTGVPICLAKWYPDIEKVYTNGYNIVWWHQLDELAHYIKGYLDPKNEGERGAIALNGIKLAQSKFTFDSMIKEIIKLWKQNK